MVTQFSKHNITSAATKLPRRVTVIHSESRYAIICVYIFPEHKRFLIDRGKYVNKNSDGHWCG